MIVANSSPLNSSSSSVETAKTTTNNSSSIARDVKTGAAKIISVSPERPPRSIEQPLAKSAFSRPKQSKRSLHCYENETPTDHTGVLISRPCIPPNNELPLFRDRWVVFRKKKTKLLIGKLYRINDVVCRSAAETEAAHDLLELSRSLPPLPPPSVAIGPQNVIEHPASDVQEMTVYQPSEQPIYQVNTIDLTGAAALYHPQPQHPHIHQTSGPPTGIIYEPATLLHAVSRLFHIYI